MTRVQNIFRVALALATTLGITFIVAPSSSADSLPFYSGVSNQPINLLGQFPENLVSKQLDERLIQTALNNISQAGLLMRSLNAVSIPAPMSAIVGSNPGASDGTYCSSFEDPLCAKLTNLYYQIALTPCLTAAQTDCISKFSVVLMNGTIEEAKPLAPLTPSKNLLEISGDVAKNIPNGGVPYVWTFPTLEHRGGKLFLPQVTMMNYGKTVDLANRTNFKFDPPEFKVAINPVSPEATSKAAYGAIDQGSYSLLPDTFLEESTFTLEFRTSIPWRTWSRSTITDFELTSSQVGKNYLYTVKGKPAKVPVIAQTIPWTKENIDSLRSIDLGGVSVAQQCDNNSKNDPYQCRASIDIGMGKANFDAFFKMFSSTEKYADPKATLAPTRWTVESVPAFNQLYGSGIFGEGSDGVSCVRDYGLNSPMGVTSSNATLATDGPPTWDKTTASLNYKVASLHSLPDGNDLVGHYTLQIPKKLAECLWGKQASNAKAVVSILDDTGGTQVVTATTGVSNEYFRFNVAGFHFSSPKISISMKSVDTKTPSATPTATSSMTLKKIVCLKGKLKKIVSGKAPICPSGYKLQK